MIPFRKSIGFRLLIVSFILLALPLLVDSFILIQKRYRHTIDDAKNSLVEIANLRELPLAQIQPLNRPLIQLLIQSMDLEKKFPKVPSEKLNQELKKLADVGEFYNISLIKVTKKGEYLVLASGIPEEIGKDFSDFFKINNLDSPEALERGYESYISFDNKTLEPYYIVAKAIYSDKENRMIGVLAISDNITIKLHQLLKPDRHHYPVNFALLAPSTIVFAASDPELRFQYFKPLSPDYRKIFDKVEAYAAQKLPAKSLQVVDRETLPFFEFNWQGEDQIGYIKHLPNANYALLTYASKQDIFKAPLVDFLDIYSVYGVILLVGGTLATLLTMRMAKPMRSLSHVMQKIQQGDLNDRYQKDLFGFEINVLGNIFNEMVDAVLEKKRSAEDERVKSEIFEKELLLGREVQRNLLPQTMPHYPGVDVAEIYIPAREVGGDFYDVFVKDDQVDSKLVLVIADASGKGVQACFYSLSVKNIFRTFAAAYSDISVAMSNTNNLFREDTADSGMFVTVLAGVYDCKTHELSYFSCGHNPGLIRRANGRVEILKHAGMAMGVAPYEKIQTDIVQLGKGDTVVFYTDGITEAHNSEYEFYGEKQLIECVSKKDVQSASELVQRVVKSVDEFVGNAAQHDDITLLVMRITE